MQGNKPTKSEVARNQRDAELLREIEQLIERHTHQQPYIRNTLVRISDLLKKGWAMNKPITDTSNLDQFIQDLEGELRVGGGATHDELYNLALAIRADLTEKDS